MLQTTETILKIFADKNRLRILHLLQQRKMCVCELAFILKVTQPSISRHLKKMKESGVVADEQDGFWTNYYLKKGSPMATTLLKGIKAYLKDDVVVKMDLDRLKKVNRTKLCQ